MTKTMFDLSKVDEILISLFDEKQLNDVPNYYCGIYIGYDHDTFKFTGIVTSTITDRLLENIFNTPRKNFKVLGFVGANDVNFIKLKELYNDKFIKAKCFSVIENKLIDVENILRDIIDNLDIPIELVGNNLDVMRKYLRLIQDKISTLVSISNQVGATNQHLSEKLISSDLVTIGSDGRGIMGFVGHSETSFFHLNQDHNRINKPIKKIVEITTINEPGIVLPTDHEVALGRLE